MVGGTGMYIKAFCEGLDEVPAIDASIRNAVISSYKKKGLLWLQNEVQKKDPTFWLKGEQKNPQRLMRALEVSIATGASITTFQKNLKIKRPFEIINIGVELPRQLLHRNIETRVEKMIEEGLVEEVSLLMPYWNINALQTVGYKEIRNHLEGRDSLDQAIEQIKRNTKHYAKRQLTWFKKDTSGEWFGLTNYNINSVITHIQAVLSL
jgi:tRNA dimethylallyltransferase